MTISRGSLHAELQLPGGDVLQLSSIHTSAGTDVVVEGLNLQHTRLFKGSNVEGLAQTKEAVAKAAAFFGRNIGKGKAATHHSMFCGDFNFTPRSAEYQEASKVIQTTLGLTDVYLQWQGQPTTGGAANGASYHQGAVDEITDRPPTFGLRDPATGESLEWLMTQTADLAVNKAVDFIFSDMAPMSSLMVDRLPAPAEEMAKYQQVSDHAALIVRVQPPSSLWAHEKGGRKR